MQTQLLIGRIAQGRVVRVVGRGTMQQSVAFRDAVLPILDSELVVFDASECEYLDSTFLGCLVGIQKTANASTSGRFAIAASHEDRVKLFSLSALDKFFHFLDACPELTSELTPAGIDALDTPTLGRHVATCHASLAEQGGPEADTFRSIVERLTHELDRE